MADRHHRIVATWSGGIDSTGVIANLLAQEWDVHAVSLTFGDDDEFSERERQARKAQVPLLVDLPGLFVMHEDDAPWLFGAFSSDSVEVPYRNKRIIDHLIAGYCVPLGIRNIGMGEYIGCDTWLVRDHVGAQDCDARALTAYVFNEYGLDWRLVTLADFGESRYKSDRLKLLYDVHPDLAALTTNCLADSALHCGRCYKCIERSAAWFVLGIHDPTTYLYEPRAQEAWSSYVAQMHGENVTVPHASIAAG